MTRAKAPHVWVTPVTPHSETSSYFITRAFVGDKKAGEMELRLLGDRRAVRVISVFVKPQYRRRGVATKLYEEAARFADSRGDMLVSDVNRTDMSDGFWKKQVTKGRATPNGSQPDGRPGEYQLKPGQRNLSGLGANLKKLEHDIEVGKKSLRGHEFPTENVVQMAMPFSWWDYPGKQQLLWAFDTKPHTKSFANGLRTGKRKLWTFKQGGLLLGGSPITDLWLKKNDPPVGAVAHFRIGIGSDFIYIDMMSVNPSWQRRGINTALLLLLLKEQPNRRLIFSKTTHAGQAFAEAWRRLGYKVEVEGEERKKAIRLLVE